MMRLRPGGLRFFLPAAVFLVLLPALAWADEPHWDYYSHGGAGGWGALTDSAGQAAFPACNGVEQSPVDISNARHLESALQVEYVPGAVDIVDVGHNFQANTLPGSALIAGGKRYELLQFHFHSPSEHTIEGHSAVLEVHFVHRARDGEIAVLGVLLRPDNPNEAFQVFLDNLPESGGEASATTGVDLASLLPDDLSHWAYDGSLTTPPCSEGVQWYVLSEPVSVSLPQLGAFRALAFLHHEDDFAGNARPVQPLNGRLGDAAADQEGGGRPAIVPPSTGDAGLLAN